MYFAAWLLIAIGAELVTAGTMNKNPWKLLLSLITKGELPTETWFDLPTILTNDTGGGTATWYDAPGSQARSIVLDYARKQIGKPYVWGAAGPNAFDCSGLTMRAMEQAGVKLPHNAAQQQRLGVGVAYASASPGDLLFWGPVSGHTAIYVGSGRMIEAPNSREKVKETNVYNVDKVNARSYLP